MASYVTTNSRLRAACSHGGLMPSTTTAPASAGVDAVPAAKNDVQGYPPRGADPV